MSSLTGRVLAALGENLNRDSWQSLIDLFRADPEAFYLLACAALPENAPTEVHRLGVTAARIRTAVRESYQIEPTANGAVLISFSGDRTDIPAGLVPSVRSFLQELDGKTRSDRPGKDYEGVEISEAEVHFKLGTSPGLEAERRRREELLDSTPIVLQIDPEDRAHLASQPAYATHQLLNCARRTVLAPTAVFRGLKRGGDAPPNVNDG